MPTRLEPITPGEILLKEFLEPMGISQNKLACDIDVPITRINDIIHANTPTLKSEGIIRISDVITIS